MAPAEGGNGLRELFRGKRSHSLWETALLPSLLSVSRPRLREDVGAADGEGVSCFQPDWAHLTVGLLTRQGGAGGLHGKVAGRASFSWEKNKLGSYGGVRSSQRPCTHRWEMDKCVDRLGLQVCLPPLLFWMMTQQRLALLHIASLPCGILSCSEVAGGSESGAQSPLVSMAVTEAGVEEREVVAEVLSRAGLGTLQSADRAEEPLPPGSRGRLWLWGLWPCRFWPQRRWCRSQSLCWQKEPQYRAMLQPLQVSLALRPQFQLFCKTQASVSCWDPGGHTCHHVPAPLQKRRRGRVGRVWALGLHTPAPVLPALPLLSVYFFCVTGRPPALGCGDSDMRGCDDMCTQHCRAGASPAEGNNSLF